MVETVFAKSSGSGVSAICVIRISGPDALKTINTLLKSDLKSPPRYAILRTLWWGKVKLDQALIIYFATLTFMSYDYHFRWCASTASFLQHSSLLVSKVLPCYLLLLYSLVPFISYNYI